MYAEALEVILRGMTNTVLSFEGKYYNYRRCADGDDTVSDAASAAVVRPGPGRGDPLGGAEQGQHRRQPAGPGMRALTDRYRAEWEALGNDPADLPLMGVGRHVVVAQTEKEALEIARRGYDKWRASFLKLWIEHDMMPVAHAIFPERSRMRRRRAGRLPARRTRCGISCSGPSTKPG